MTLDRDHLVGSEVQKVMLLAKKNITLKKTGTLDQQEVDVMTVVTSNACIINNSCISQILVLFPVNSQAHTSELRSE